MQSDLPLKYSHYDVVFQEVPGEISLAIDISGCPHKCKGCHSDFLWKYEGNLLKDDLEGMLIKYDGMITCVCFMGGDQNIKELTHLVKFVHNVYCLRTCVYSGLSDYEKDFWEPIIPYLDYLKIGDYQEKFGGLDHKTTNQVFYKVNQFDGSLENITYKFQKEHKE